jgi:hypothetical protein
MLCDARGLNLMIIDTNHTTIYVNDYENEYVGIKYITNPNKPIGHMTPCQITLNSNTGLYHSVNLNTAKLVADKSNRKNLDINSGVVTPTENMNHESNLIL